VLLYHGSFVDDDSLELTVAQSLGTRLAHCRDDDLALLQNVLFKVILILDEFLELLLRKLLDCLDVAAKDVGVLLLECRLYFADI